MAENLILARVSKASTKRSGRNPLCEMGGGKVSSFQWATVPFDPVLPRKWSIPRKDFRLKDRSLRGEFTGNRPPLSLARGEGKLYRVVISIEVESIVTLSIAP